MSLLSRPNRLVTALGLAAFLSSPSLLAHEEDAPREDERYRAPTHDEDDYRSEQYLAFELRFGPYRPDVDAEFGGTGPFQDTFGSGESIYFGLEVDWQAIRIPYFGSIGPGFGWGIVRYAGYSTFAARPGRSAQLTTLWASPFYGVGVVRVDVLAQEFGIPFVPYAKGGAALAIWEAGDAGSASVDAEGVVGQGLELGYQFQLGMMLHLNFFAPQSAVDLDNTSGVNNAYLFLEWMKSDIDSFGSGMQVGTSTWVTGIAIEY